MGRSKGKSNSRLIAAKLLAQLIQGRSLSELLESGLSRLDERDQGFVKELLFGVCRRYYQLEALAGLLVSKPLKSKEREVKALILLGLYQLMYTRVAPHAAVAESAEVARILRKNWAVGLINAVLRRFQREHESLVEQVNQVDSVNYGLPGWLLSQLKQAWPDQWQVIAVALNSHPPMSLRVNTRKVARDHYQATLQQANIASRTVNGAPEGLVLDTPMSADKLPGFSSGVVSVQDCGAQLAVHLMDLSPSHRVLDACAAPGGKSCHMLELSDGLELTAVDVDPSRLKMVAENLHRLGLEADAVVGDASQPKGDWALPESYDRILLDVPCSATGVIRRHPDIKLLRREDDISPLVQLQEKILSSIWPLLKPGGLLVYGTCSLLPAENEQQVASFIQKREDASEKVIDATWGYPRTVGRQTLPGEETMDGFYYACLQKG